MTSTSLAWLTVTSALVVGCGRSHGADGVDASVDAATPRDMPEADAFDRLLALGCGWETVEVEPGVSLRGVHGYGEPGDVGPAWLVGGEGHAFGVLYSAPPRVVRTEGGALLSSAWHDGVDSLWATELPGAMMRLRGDEWERFESGVGQALLAVDGSAPDSAWAVGIDGVMTHWDGDGWTASPSLVPHHLRGVSALAADDVWAVGSTDEGGAILHFDGEEWSIEELDARLHDVAGESPDDLWAVGAGVFHWDGRGWTEEDVGAPGEWIAVTTIGDRVWLAGAANRVMMRQESGEWLTALEDVGFLWDVWVHPFTGDVWVPSEGLAHRCVPFAL